MFDFTETWYSAGNFKPIKILKAAGNSLRGKGTEVKRSDGYGGVRMEGEGQGSGGEKGQQKSKV